MLRGGIANAGAVVRVGSHVFRPTNPFSTSIHRFLRAVRETGFDGVPMPFGIMDEREELEFREGDVGLPPYPDWVRTDTSLGGIAALMLRFHQASSAFNPAGLPWSTEMADPEGGTVVCHNDVCLENVVFQNGEAVGLIDFDFAAPGRPIYDLATMARHCVPLDDDVTARWLGWVDPDRARRLRLVCETYGLTGDERHVLVGAVDRTMAAAGRFVRQRVEQGDPNFILMWNAMGGQQRFSRRSEWWDAARDGLLRAIL